MKFNITLNQPQMIKHNLNVTQWCILDIISIAPSWCEAITKDGEVYFWIARQKIAEELKALDLKADTIYRILKKLVVLGFLEYEKSGKKDLIKLSKKGKDLFVSAMSETNPNHYVGNKSENNSEKNPTYNNTITNNKTQYDDFINYLKKACKYKTKVTKTKDGEVLFKQIENKHQLVKDYINHQELKKEYSVRITAFMEDYETVYKQQEENRYEEVIM